MKDVVHAKKGNNLMSKLKKGVHNGGVAKKDKESKVFPFTSISPTPWTQLNQSLTFHSFIIKTIPWVKPTTFLIFAERNPWI